MPALVRPLGQPGRLQRQATTHQQTQAPAGRFPGKKTVPCAGAHDSRHAQPDCQVPRAQGLLRSLPTERPRVRDNPRPEKTSVRHEKTCLSFFLAHVFRDARAGEGGKHTSFPRTRLNFATFWRESESHVRIRTRCLCFSDVAGVRVEFALLSRLRSCEFRKEAHAGRFEPGRS
jgi:hypothetical protein